MQDQRQRLEMMTSCYIINDKGRGPCLYLHAGGPGNFWPACRMLTETEDEGEGSGMSVLPSAAALGCEYLISSGNPRGFDGREFER